MFLEHMGLSSLTVKKMGIRMNPTLVDINKGYFEMSTSGMK
jgi:hypothetical protein